VNKECCAVAESSGLLVKVRGDGQGFAAKAKSLRIGKVDIEPIMTIPPTHGEQPGIAPDSGATWLRIDNQRARSENPWDAAHEVIANARQFAAAGGPEMLAVEPDMLQRWSYPDSEEGGRTMAATAAPVCAFDDQESRGGKATVPGIVAWNAGNSFSQFKTAREAAGAKQANIVIAHLDTGLDPAHQTAPAALVPQGSWRNFVRDGHGPTDAVDHAPAGSPVANRGHGTGTISLLAGNSLDGASPDWPGFTDFIGGAPLAGVIPVRIADWVVRFTTSTMVQGFDYARQQGAHVLSMSMGGLTSSALVDAVNLAYDHGVVLVTAAGNNFAGLPSPKSIVFPARYKRVLAACGVMGDGHSYSGLQIGTMQGNFGPGAKMETALGAYTPNVPWAEIDCAKVVDMNGAGTSAATPQIAAAAALWLAEHWDVVKNYSQPWMRVEAVRFALFSSAQKSTPKMNASETFQKIGQGVVRASDALSIAPRAEALLHKLPLAEESWGWLNLILGGGVSLSPADAISNRKHEMLALELTQMAQRVASVDEAIADPGADPQSISAAARNRYLEAALDEGNPSRPLRAMLEAALGRTATVAPRPTTTPTVKRKRRPPPPPGRRLRIYALDPSIGKRLASVSVFQATLSLPWDDVPSRASPLLPGPIGEYIEVIDVDPASNRVYEPVDLNEKTLLAQDGLAPSEGNPQFHQQMVYAVAMTTIGHFERALGRRALWAPRNAKYVGRGGRSRTKTYEVPRLRIYPHALRTDNAYYSPEKKALLFGYFPAEGTQGDTTTPGSTVFSCLSSDIIAHETSHALLDGLHRRFQEASNPDVPSFHEGFADIVALFQHFTIKELVSFEIARARGNLSAPNLLSGLAKQFGEGSGRAGPLRDYAEAKMVELDYQTTFEPHDRGSILVFAVYEAFLAIVERRTEILVQLATGGSGILPGGALHPNLVDKLTEEICKTARQILTMCIRALDYCPAVDITFGEYLRALVTSDIDACPDDPLHYRLALMESFRNWKLLPRDVRTVSEETLAWNTLDDPSPDWLKGLLKNIDLGWNQQLDRSEIFDLNESNRWKLWTAMRKAFAEDPGLYGQFGLLANLPRYNEDGTLFRKAKKGESTFDALSVRPTRRVEPDGSFRTEVIAVIHQRVPVRLDGGLAINGVTKGEDFFWFRGGATVIIDPRQGQEEIRYSIIKNTGSETRAKRQATTAGAHFMSPLRALYFGDAKSEPFALLHAIDGDDDLG
jgi:Subtilase family